MTRTVIQVKAIRIRLLRRDLHAVAHFESKVLLEFLRDPTLTVQLDDQIDRGSLVGAQHIGSTLDLVVGHIQVEVAVGVHVRERGAGATERRGEARVRGCVLERAVPAVQEERVRTSECGDEEIQATVAVDVRERCARGVAAGRAYPRLFGHVFEAPSAQIPVESVGALQARKIQVGKSVTVVVPHCHTRAHEQVVMLDGRDPRQSIPEVHACAAGRHLGESRVSPLAYRELAPSEVLRLLPRRGSLACTAGDSEKQ